MGVGGWNDLGWPVKTRMIRHANEASVEGRHRIRLYFIVLAFDLLNVLLTAVI
jgi:hypothetical protein